ncbi:Uncharacterised protein [uncultured Flavonifractor sp.]|nr:Uncharacterised protein [uncultured Flavonifractor sp.]
MSKVKSLSAKVSLLSAALNLVTLVIFCIYGAVYDYFDTVVFAALALGVVCAVLYALMDNKVAEVLNLAAVLCVSFGVGLFFLNSYPVWADRLNNITMYGSRGTLFPVVSIMILCFVTVIIEIVSCFTRKERI